MPARTNEGVVVRCPACSGRGWRLRRDSVSIREECAVCQGHGELTVRTGATFSVEPRAMASAQIKRPKEDPCPYCEAKVACKPGDTCPGTDKFDKEPV